MSSPGGTRRALLTLVGGSLLAVGAPGAWLLGQDRAPAAFGAGAAAALAAPAPVPASVSVPSPRAGAPTPVTRSARLADVEVPVVDPPVEVRLPGGAAAVVPVGVDGTGLVQVPADVGTAGWYAPGPAPGAAAGSAVLVGHVDAAGQGLGRFAELRELEPGDRLEVRLAGGAVLAYDVLAREQWHKAELPVERLFAGDGPRRLVLLSCAGAFDERTRSYRDNVAVTAVPVP